MADRSRTNVSQYVKSWQQANPSKTYFTDFAGGGVLWVGSSYKWHIFTSSGTWTAPVTNADVIVVGGGGGTGREGGGGGAGGVRNLIAATFVVGNTYTVTVGAAGTMSNTVPTAGGNSSITTSGATISATGGGRGGVSGQAAGNGGSGGGAWYGGSAGTGNAGGYTPVEGYAGGAGRNVAGAANGSGGGAGGAALAALQGSAFFGNRDVSGKIGAGFNLPDDCSNAPIFDGLRVANASSQYRNTINANLAIAFGGMGQGYAGNVGFLTYSVDDNIGAYTGGISTTYNGACVAARGYGNGACSGTGTYGNIASGTAGIVIIRYAL
jgi:hypothetical protein